MKIKLLSAILVLLIGTMGLFSAAPVAIDELSRPSMFLVKYDRIYILEKATVYIYSLKEVKLIKKFGKAGEGPQEFNYSENNNRPLTMCFKGDELMVSSLWRLSFFDKDGNFLREQKIPVDRLLFPIGDQFLGIGLLAGKDKRQYLGFTLHSADFKTEKKLFVSDMELNNPRKLELPVTSFTYNPVYKDKVFINANSIDFKIQVFDKKGDTAYTINKNYDQLAIPASFKKDADNFFKSHPKFKRQYEFIKRIVSIRKNFPPIRDMFITDDMIYVITFKRQDGLWECVKMDLKGKELGRKFIPLDKYEHFTFYPILYSVYQGKVYSLVEDEDEEVWKLHMTDFK